MDKTELPHAIGEMIVKGWPRNTLYVATPLPRDFGKPAFDADAKQELERAVAARCAADDLEHEIRWSYRLKAPTERSA